MTATHEFVAACGTPASAETSSFLDYEDANLRVVSTDPRGIRTITQSDSLGRTVELLREHPKLASAYGAARILLESYQYDAAGNTIVFRDAQGNETHSVYDGANRLVAVIEGLATGGATVSGVTATTRYTYDDAGNLRTVKDGRSHGGQFDVSNEYDDRYRKIAETNGAGEITRFQYDPNSNLVAVIEPLGDEFVTRYQYDELGALLSVDETRGGAGGITFFRYDANRNKIAQQDANGNLVTYQYDALNRLTDTFQHVASGTISVGTRRGSDFGGDAPSALHWEYDYDGNSNQTLIVDAKGQQMVMDYDYRDRLIGVEFVVPATLNGGPNPEFGLDFQPQQTTYVYDGNNNLHCVSETGATGVPRPKC